MLAPHVWALAKIVVAGHVGGAARVAVHVPETARGGKKERGALAEGPALISMGRAKWKKEK